jgi:ABC-type glutathione transport system ATPase component
VFTAVQDRALDRGGSTTSSANGSRRPARRSCDLSAVVKKFGDAVAVNGVSLDIAKGEIFALLGSSGCGKTTLLRMLGGLRNADFRPDPAERAGPGPVCRRTSGR